MSDHQRYGWRELSVAYIFKIVESSRFITGLEQQLHPEAKTYFNFVLNCLQQYQCFPTDNHLREYLNLHRQHHAIAEYSVEEIADRIRLEKVKYDATEAIANMQKVLTLENVQATDILKPLLALQDKIFNAKQAEIHWLSQFADIMHYYRESGGDKVCDYGLPTLDKYTGGLCRGDFIIIYANQSEGKSTLSRHIAGRIAEQAKIVLYFTLEESGKKSVLKTISTQVQTNFNDLMEGTYTHETYQKLGQYRPKGNVAFVDYLESGEISEIARYVHEVNPDVIIVDQIPHLIKASKHSQWEEVSRISRQLRSFAQLNKIPMIALTQANRQGKQKKNPTLEESMSMAYAQAQDASQVLFLHPDESGPGYTRKRVTLLKNRDHQRGQSIDLKWDIAKGVVEEEVITMEYYQNGGSYYAPNLGSTEALAAISSGVHHGSHPQPMAGPNNGQAVGGSPVNSAGIQQSSYQQNPAIQSGYIGGPNYNPTLPFTQN